jgi:integrase/recombinase XerD
MSKRKAPQGTYWRGNTLWAYATIGGRCYRWSLRTDDFATAQRRREEGKARLVGRKFFGERGRLTFAEAIESWGAVIDRKVAQTTRVRYAVSLGQLQLFLDGKFLDEIDGVLLADIIRQRQAHGVTQATIKRDLVALSSVINHAIDQGWCDNNPVLPRMRRLRERREPIVLPRHEDIQAVIRRAPGMFANLIVVACLTGCRQGELVTAKREQIDHPRKVLTVVGKGRKRRAVSLEPFNGYEAVRTLPAALGGAYLFWHGQGERYHNVASRFRAIVRAVEEEARRSGRDFRPFRFHDLRHRHAVDWLLSGRSIYDLQQRLGHSSLKVTEIYLAFLTEDEARKVKQGAHAQT